MHMVILHARRASTEDDALATGKTVFDRLVGAVPRRRCLRLLRRSMKKRHRSPARSDGATYRLRHRWTPMKGELLERGWAGRQPKTSSSGISTASKEALDELSDEEIMRDEDLARHAFHQVGAYDGPSVFLYDEHGSAVGIAASWTESSRRAELWIVPADVHF